MHARTHYTKLVILHPAGSVGQILHSGASRVQNVDANFSCSGGSDADLKKAHQDTLHQTCDFASWDLWVT
jgi:hypothetical protein